VTSIRCPLFCGQSASSPGFDHLGHLGEQVQREDEGLLRVAALMESNAWNRRQALGELGPVIDFYRQHVGAMGIDDALAAKERRQPGVSALARGDSHGIMANFKAAPEQVAEVNTVRHSFSS
jgi:hypothetical protein